MERKRLRELGVSIGQLPTGQKNCITDVEGVSVGHVTLQQPLIDDDMICTGVTAILPHRRNLFQEKVVAASHVINGFGKTTGLVQVEELGVIESPIMLTNTFAVPAVTQGTLEYMLAGNPDIGETTGTINIVTGECNDSYLNSIRLLPIKPEHAIQAIHNASHDQVEEGAVGAGTGMMCYGFKGGIGTSSRLVKLEAEAGTRTGIGTGTEKGNNFTTYTLGCLVLSNFGRREEFRYWQYALTQSQSQEPVNPPDGSIMIVIATDAPLSDRQLKRLAKRTTIGLGRTGSQANHGSGDIAIAFSTAQTSAHYHEGKVEQRLQLREDQSVMNDLFQATAEATEEAILNSLTMAQTTMGRKGRIVEALPYNCFS